MKWWSVLRMNGRPEAEGGCSHVQSCPGDQPARLHPSMKFTTTLPTETFTIHAKTMKLSGLQRSVLSLYRQSLREARKKPAVGFSLLLLASL